MTPVGRNTNGAAPITLDFDLAKVIEQSKDNAVFYVQNAHARAKSVLRQALAAFPDLDVTNEALAATPLDLLAVRRERGHIRDNRVDEDGITPSVRAPPVIDARAAAVAGEQPRECGVFSECLVDAFLYIHE